MRDALMGRPPYEKALETIYQHVKSNDETLTRGDVILVWFSKTLQNWKALVIVNRPGETYYEVTFNGDKNEVYIDTYEKRNNIAISLT